MVYADSEAAPRIWPVLMKMRMTPASLAPFGYSQLVWSTVLGYAVFGDFPDSGSLLGMAIVVIAGLLALNWKQMRRPPEESSENNAD